jgi:hypothetical protein
VAPIAIAAASSACVYAVLSSLIFVGSDAMFVAADLAWYLGLVTIAFTCFGFAVTRKKSFIFLFLFWLLIICMAAYVRNGGEGTPLPYAAGSR